MAQTPNQYHLQGGGISISYFPGGEGPIRLDQGPLVFSYQDTQQSHGFFSDEVRTVEVADLGTVVSVTLALTVDTGSTTFSLLVPEVQLPDQPDASVFVQTEGITTVHRLFLGLIAGAQHETYTVTALSGTAAFGPLAV